MSRVDITVISTFKMRWTFTLPPNIHQNWKEVLACQFRVFLQCQCFISHQYRGTPTSFVPKMNCNNLNLIFADVNWFFECQLNICPSLLHNGLHMTVHASNWLTFGWLPRKYCHFPEWGLQIHNELECLPPANTSPNLHDPMYISQRS